MAPKQQPERRPGVTRASRRWLPTAAVLLLAITAAAVFYRQPLWLLLRQAWALLTDRQRTEAFLASFGNWAPVVFIGLQVLQVIFAPIPGEATGFIGGYLFGTGLGFVYSTIGLSIGSLVNFAIGRFFGKRYVRRLIPSGRLSQMDRFVRHQGIFVLFVLFVFPGFPKDYLCLFLGMSALPTSVFLLIAIVGRMPGTLLLSLQGASLFQGQYVLLAGLVALCMLLVFPAYRWRDALYRWIEKHDNQAEKR